MATPYPPQYRRSRWHWVWIPALSLLTLALLAIVAGFFVVQNFHVRQNSHDSVAIDLPGGHIDIRSNEKLSPASLGVPIYPGAKRLKGDGGATFSWSAVDGRNEKSFAVAGAELFTRDKADSVLSFYREQLPNWIVVTEHNGATRLERREGGMKRIIVVRPEWDGTHIGVATVGEPASN